MDHQKPPITDSPWFWVYLFATAGLIALMLAGNKYDHRQAEIEREFSARQSHGYSVSGDEGPITPPTSGHQVIRLKPLYIVLAVMLVCGWAIFYTRRMTRQT